RTSADLRHRRPRLAAAGWAAAAGRRTSGHSGRKACRAKYPAGDSRRAAVALPVSRLRQRRRHRTRISRRGRGTSQRLTVLRLGLLAVPPYLLVDWFSQPRHSPHRVGVVVHHHAAWGSADYGGASRATFMTVGS